MSFGPHIVLFSCSCLLLQAMPLAAQNLLTNPDFDTDLSGWTATGSGVFDGTTDSDGSPSSGSVRAAGTIVPNVNATQGARQCVTGIVAGSTYAFGGDILVSQIPAGGSGWLGLQFYSNNGCSLLLTAEQTPFVTTLNSWQSAGGSGVAPAGAAAAVVITLISSGAGGDFAVNDDDLFLQRRAQVPTMSSAWLAALGLTLMLTAGAALVRFRRA